jgi:uncharacterized protein YbjT (DUF2867 family)
MIETILVIGATGRLGEPVARQLISDGYGVRALTRSADKARARFGQACEIATGDVDDVASLEAALQGCQAAHINLHGAFDADLERRGAENLAQATRKTGLERITYLSGASVCAENCWYEGTRARFQAEQAICSSGIPYTIFRAHFFMETLHNLVHGKLALEIGRHPHSYPWVAASDYARMVARAYAVPEAVDKTLYVCGPEELSMHRALQIFCRIAHPQARQVFVPIWMASTLAFLGRRRELQDALPFFRYCERVKIILSGSPQEANALLGAPTTTLEAWSRAQAVQA